MQYTYLFIFVNIKFFFVASVSRAFYVPSIIRRPLVNAFLASSDTMTSLIILLQQICNGLSRQVLFTTPSLAKQNKFSKNVNSDDQIIEMREFLSQVVIDIVRNLKHSQGFVEIVQELLEVNCTNLYKCILNRIIIIIILFYENF